MNIHTLIRALRYDDPQTPICIRHNDKDVPLMLSDVWLWRDTDNKVVLTISTHRVPSEPKRLYKPDRKLTILSLMQYIHEQFEIVESTDESDVQIENLNGHTQSLDIEWIHAKYDKLILLAP